MDYRKRAFCLMVLPLFFLAGLNSCKWNDADIDVSSSLGEDQQDEFVYSIIRYIGKLPGKANHSNKFGSEHDDYYRELAKRHRIQYYFKTKQEEEYFLVTRIAPSIQEKYVAIGGKLRRNKKDNSFDEYEEIFRTWKMPKDELLSVSDMLFRKMVDGKDLSEFYPENSGSKYIIEFPDSNVYFDKKARMWISSREDPLEPLYKIKEQTERDAMIANPKSN